MPYHKSIFYQTHGDQSLPAAVFLHGFLGSGHDWLDIINLLKSEYCCVTIDLPGHGKSIEIEDNLYRVESCAGAIDLIAGELKLKEYALVGYSMGGRLALYMALQYPKKLKALILESASPGLKTSNEREARVKSDAKLAEEILKVPMAQFIRDWYSQPIFATLKNYPEKFKRLCKAKESNDPTGLSQSLKYMGTGAQPSLWEQLRNLVCPTLLIVGELDHKFKAIATDMQNRAKVLKIEMIKSAGHNAHFEKPEEFAGALKKFLR